jgi:hypothetical protein
MQNLRVYKLQFRSFSTYVILLFCLNYTNGYSAFQETKKVDAIHEIVVF